MLTSRAGGWGLAFLFKCLLYVSMFLIHVAASLRSAYRHRAAGGQLTTQKADSENSVTKPVCF